MMNPQSEPARRLHGRSRSGDRTIGFQRWTNLLFVHWRFPVAVVQSLLPASLSVDAWNGDAWIGLVPFYMSGVRPWWSPAVPGISSFCETNVRTYVRYRGGEPGVWFFSLEASSSLAVRIARWRWWLPYFRADMELRREGDRIHYESRRRGPGPGGAGCRINAVIGHEWPNESEAANDHFPGRARPGTLEHFLVERYVLYTQAADGRLLSGRVHHTPYPLRTVKVERLEETLLSAAGLPTADEFCHAAFSEGVSVRISPLLPAD